jgi:hypothetical protein
VTALLKELAVIGVALLVAAGAVAGLGDRGVLVPPPEMVVEQFVRDVSLKRWEPARTHLAEPLARRMGPDSLRGFVEAVERRVGPIEDVKGRPFFSTDVAAEADAEITSAGGDRTTLRLPLSREHGLWKISRLDAGS